MAKKQNKKVQYLLLTLVIIIWSIIIYRVLNYSQNDEIVITQTNISLPTKTIDQKTEDRFTLTGGYDDPFFKKRRRASKKRRKASNTKKSKNKKMEKIAQKPIMEEKMPRVFYKAFSLNNNEVTRVKLEIDGKSYTIKPNEEILGIKVLNMNKNSITILWKEETHILNRT